ncbi:hypothetical protein OROGR_030331 [Orobanche gracilis]
MFRTSWSERWISDFEFLSVTYLAQTVGFLVNLYPHFDFSGDFGGLRFRGFYSSHIWEVFHLPIVGRRRVLIKDGVSGGFVGHLTVNRAMHWRQREEMRNAVATSHFSQSNTIEYTLALQWRLLQEKSELWWTALHEEQNKENEALVKQMKIRDLE